MSRRSIDIVAAIVPVMLKAPRTAPEVAKLIDAEQDIARKHLVKLTEAGVLKMVGRVPSGNKWGPRTAIQYAWALKPEYEA